MAPKDVPHVISADGTRIWAEGAGNQSKTPVIFIHALACTAFVWDKQFADGNLLKDLYMVRYELRGHGRSDSPLDAEAYSSRKYAEDFMAVCQAFDIRNPFVCAWSLGAFIPVDVVEAFGPDHIAGVVFSGGPGIARDIHPEVMNSYLQDKFLTFRTADGDQLPRAANLFVDSCLKNPQRDLPMDKRLQWLAGFLMQPPTVRQNTVNRAQSSARWQREFTHKPHMLMQGMDDLHTDATKAVRVAKRLFRDVEIHLFEGVGHALAWEAPERHNKLLWEFLRRCTNHTSMAVAGVSESDRLVASL